jgi:hypothetical protein
MTAKMTDQRPAPRLAVVTSRLRALETVQQLVVAAGDVAAVGVGEGGVYGVGEEVDLDVGDLASRVPTLSTPSE